jgi:hypothetical protein
VIEHPENVATPELAVSGSDVHARVPVPVEIASVTEAELVGTTLPAASSTEMTGWTLRSDPPVDAVGSVVKMSLVAAP